MALAVVQQGDVTAGSTASGSAGTVLPVNATNGHAVALAIVLGVGTVGEVSSVTSPMGTFTKVVAAETAGTDDQEWWVCLNVTGAGKTVTVTSGGVAWYGNATEISGGVASAATGGDATGVSTTAALTTGSVTAGQMALVQVDAPNYDTSHPTAPWTNYNAGFWIANNGLDVAYQVPGSTGTLTATWVGNALGSWGALGLILTPSASTNNSDEFFTLV